MGPHAWQDRHHGAREIRSLWAPPDTLTSPHAAQAIKPRQGPVAAVSASHREGSPRGLGMRATSPVVTGAGVRKLTASLLPRWQANHHARAVLEGPTG